MYESQGESTAVVSWQTEKGWRHCIEYYLPEQQQGEWLCLRPHFCLRPSLVQAASLQWYLRGFYAIHIKSFAPSLSTPGPTSPNILWKYSKHWYFLDLRHYLWIASGRSLVDYGKTKNWWLRLRNSGMTLSYKVTPLATSGPSPCKCPNGLKLWATSAVGLICFVNHLQSCCILGNSSFQRWRAQPIFLQGSQGAWEAA